MKTPNYKCSQAALYQVARNVYQSMADNLAQFTDFKSKYTNAYLDSVRDEINNAEAIPDFRGRSGNSELAYINLNKQLDQCASMWQILKRYIQAAFTEDTHKVHFEQAGFSHYEKAVKRNWDEAHSLMLSGKLYINSHLAELSANDNMPASFPAKFEAEQNTFNTMLTTYQQLSEKIKEGTESKMDINNSIYDKVIEICLDGQQIFKTVESKKDQFTFSAVLSIVSGNGTTGFKGYIFNALTNQPLQGVSITSTGFSKTTVSDEEGFYEVIQIAAGTYPLAFSLPGYNSHTIAAYQVDSGTTHNLNINLTPITES